MYHTHLKHLLRIACLLVLTAGCKSNLAVTTATGDKSATTTLCASAVGVCTISINNPSSSLTSGGEVSFVITFASAASIQLTSDLVEIVTTDSAKAVATVSGSGTGQRTVTLTNISGSGTIKIRLKAGAALDAKGKTFPVSDWSNTVTVKDGQSTTYTAPQVTSLTGSTPNGVYAVGSVIKIAVKFSDAVTVSGGTPQLNLNLPSNGLATYTSGSGTDTLVFSYTVQAGDVISGLDTKNSSSIILNGATIKSAAGIDATTTVPQGSGASGSLAQNSSIEVNASATVVQGSFSSTTADGTYGYGSSIDIAIPFSAAATVTGTPYLVLSNGRQATYTSGSGTTTLHFTYTVQGGDSANPLDYASTSALNLNGGTIKNASNANISLFLPAPGGGSSFASVKTIVIDTSAGTYSLTLAVASGSQSLIQADGTSTTLLVATLTRNGIAENASNITITVPTNGGSVDSTTKATNSSGQATFTLTSSTTGGNYKFQVSAVAGSVFSDYLNIAFDQCYGSKLTEAPFANWTGGTDPGGTILICTDAQMRKIYDGVTYSGVTPVARLARNYEMGHDIDLGGTAWTVIGDNTNTFTGTFDGLGFTLSNLSISVATDYVGLFGYIGSAGVVQNLVVTTTGVSAPSRYYVGVVAGFSAGKLSNVHVRGASGNGTEAVTAAYHVGGLVGYYNGNNTTTRIINECSVKQLTVSGTGYYVGGLVGVSASTGMIKLSSADVTVTASAVGSGYFGGFIGQSTGGGTIQDSYSSSSVTVTGGTGHTFIGGFVGESANTTITNVYSMGNVCSGSCSNTTNADPFGKVTSGTIKNSYWNSGTAGGWSSTTSGAFSLTDSEFKVASNFGQSVDVSFDFMTIWRLSSTTSYPVLQWQEPLSSAYTVSGLFAGGSGTVGDPWQITTAAQLRNIANAYRIDNTALTQNYKLMNDITLTGTLFPLSSNTVSFTGTFDGNSHTINNLNINVSAYYVGLFGHIGTAGVVKDLTITTTGINAPNMYYVGVVAGYSAGKLSNVHVRGASGAGTEVVTGLYHIGGLVGYYNGGNTTTQIITQCSVKQLTVSGGGGNIGGLAGASASTGLIKLSYTDVTVTASANGVSNLGGFIGVISGSGAIQDSYTTSSVTLTGGTGHANICGFIGEVQSATLTNVYSMGNVCSGSCSNTTNADPFARMSGGTVTNSYWNSGTAGGWSSSVISTAFKLSDSEFKVASNFGQTVDVSFDFVNTWRISSTTTYPVLQWQEPLTTPYTMSSLFAGGSGTVGDPWQITSATQLRNIANAYRIDNTALTQSYKLMNDVTLTGTLFPLSSNTVSFTGTFDGNNHTINNVNINGSTYYVGLFGHIGTAGVVKDLTITTTGVSVPSGYYVGVVAGYSAGRISNVHVRGASGAGTEIVTAAFSVGGLVGYYNGNDTTTRIITQCTVKQLTINGTGYYFGGLVGTSASTGLISNSVADVTVTSSTTSSSYFGGFVGSMSGGGLIQNSYSKSAITVTGGTGHTAVGGFMGQLQSSTITNVYSIGSVCGGTCSNTASGDPFLGSNSGGTINHSYFNTTTSGWATSSTATAGLTDTQMTTDSTANQIVDGLDASTWSTSNWVLDPANLAGGYPKLVWEP